MATPDKYRSAPYWTQLIHLKIRSAVQTFIDENNLTQGKFAERLGESEGYVSQIMDGDFNQPLSKLVELALACNLVPRLDFVPPEYADNVVIDTYQKPAATPNGI